MASLFGFCLIGAGAAFIAAVLASRLLLGVLQRNFTRGRAGDCADQGLVRGVVSLALRNGVVALRRPTRGLLKNDSVRKLACDASRLLSERGLVCPEEAGMTLVLAALVCFGIVGVILSRNVVGGLAIDALIVAGLVTRIQAWRDRERESLRNAVPLALGVMGDCFQSGYSLMQTMRQVSEQTEGALSAVFGRCADSLELGATSREALQHIRSVEGVTELAFVAVALDVQHQSGGSFASVLGNAQRMVADEIELRRSLRVQTAQARLSAQVVCLMPFILVAVLSLVSDGFLAAFFEGPAGLALLVVALGMEAAGVMLVRRMLKVAA